ncbi:hypothetical protein [Paracraurococcus lichenis]|uniref:Uncharacterized protein n=1 Tax=Paracraurococcus lichenis TaxID=3064888 RepID=A0ABT9EEF5_9PROT|nr:hypothetical protein [Paracraurococcus sp. LOR1-02]MDO9714255.1 hypothetical protein [Paracraurococcus sp. LOR1-02]
MPTSYNLSFATISLLTLSLFSSTHAGQQNELMAKQPDGLSSEDIQTIVDHERRGMMKECLSLRENVRPGVNMSSDLKRMLAYCDQLEREMRR